MEVLVAEMLLGRILGRAGGGMMLQLTLIQRRWVCVGQGALVLAAFLGEHLGYFFSGGWTKRWLCRMVRAALAV